MRTYSRKTNGKARSNPGAHEALESVWKDACREEKDLLNGIILIAAAFVHDEKDESSICIAILSRAMKKLSRAKGLYFGVDLDETKRRGITNN
jgi:hypothetical protein